MSWASSRTSSYSLVKGPDPFLAPWFCLELTRADGTFSHFPDGGGSDNKAAENLTYSQLTTKVPLMFVLMESTGVMSCRFDVSCAGVPVTRIRRRTP